MLAALSCQGSSTSNTKAGTNAGLAVHRQAALHQLHQPARDGKAEAGATIAAAGRGLALHEGLENLRHVAALDADAGVADLAAEQHLLPGTLDHLHAYGDAARRRELDRVVEQLDQHLAQAQCIAHQLPARWQVVKLKLDAELATPGLGTEFIDHGIDQRRRRERAQLEGQLALLQPREVEDVVDHAQEVAAGLLGMAHIVALLVGEHGRLEQLQHAGDAVQRRAQLVAHHGEEFTLGTAGAIGLRARIDQVLGVAGLHLARIVQRAGERIQVVAEGTDLATGVDIDASAEVARFQPVDHVHHRLKRTPEALGDGPGKQEGGDQRQATQITDCP